MTLPGSRDDIVATVVSVRHDLNNLLMGLVGHVELLRGAKDLPEHAERRLVVIAEQLERVRDKVAELSRIESPQGDCTRNTIHRRQG